MYRLIISLSLVAAALANLDLYKECVDEYSEALPNSRLMGTWHMVWKFSSVEGLLPSSFCENRTLSVPTADTLQRYKEKYDSAGFDFTLDETSLLYEENIESVYTPVVGMYAGETQSRYMVLDPNSGMVLNRFGFKVDVFEPINDDFMIFWVCPLDSTKWLLARNRHASVEEMQAIIAATPALARMGNQRYCA